MEIRFPDHDKGNTGYRGFFLAGLRKSADDRTERTGTAVLKRTYSIDPQLGTLAPSTQPLPIFLQDYPDNLVSNGGFELFTSGGAPVDWQPESSAEAIASIVDPDDPKKQNHVLKVSGAPGGRVVQEINFGEPLGNQSFVLTCSANTDNVPATIDGVQLEAEGATGPISKKADEKWNLETKKKSFMCPGQWQPKDLSTTTMRVVITVPKEPVHSAFYDDVLVYSTLRYEHDLASFKPNGDVIVLGFTAAIPSGSTAEVWVNGATWLARTLGQTDRRHLFGWASRTEGTRRKEAVFSANPEDYPLKELPAKEKFTNLFFNGYRRDAAVKPLTYLPPNAQIAIKRGESILYRFSLPNDSVTAHYAYFGGTGPDDSKHWQRRDVHMNIDTLVIEPDKNRCYLVWRGVWPFAEQPDGAYRLLEAQASA